ncbi:hypothetical protein PVT68_18140 [Microbulbifer bruguierae]|uniref:HEPN domain-containing protein n=1 Tax=Microbulbifer bruguierae TaxID=3029061 RepID=A0ABY8NCL1_9GAMM|nr:hypothetical protein [Microbulbifer bruguierae]WGL16658.1 hypothetical protein PVT68_18140 [Microbulbifer bruguierae]
MEVSERSLEIYRAAKQFFNAAELLWDSDRSDYIFPIIVNYALACEIALKSIECKVVTPEIPDGALLADTTVVSNSWGHKLSKIHASFTPENRETLQRKYTEITSQDLASDLEKCDEYFVKARYPWEPSNKQVFSITHVRSLAKNLLVISKNA